MGVGGEGAFVVAGEVAPREDVGGGEGGGGFYAVKEEDLVLGGY